MSHKQPEVIQPTSANRASHRTSGLVCVVLVLLFTGCRQEMADQPRVETYEAADFFADKSGSRPQVAGTIARGQQWLASPETTGMSGRDYVRNPTEPAQQQLRHGQTLFTINCKHCHGPAGYGDGTVVQRGFPSPPSFHQDRLREVPDGRLFEVITKGHGRMPAFGKLISTGDRWAIVSFIRALQLSQNFEESKLTESDRSALSAASSHQNER